jgi:hypothetical protein
MLGGNVERDRPMPKRLGSIGKRGLHRPSKSLPFEASDCPQGRARAVGGARQASRKHIPAYQTFLFLDLRNLLKGRGCCIHVEYC